MGGNVVGPLIGLFNSGVAALVRAPVVGRFLGRGIAMLTYTGRRSGATFTLPVGYRRVGTDVVIGVEFPDAKAWWRNFTGDGGPLTLHLDGVDRSGHAVARREGPRRVTLTVRLDE